MYHIRTHSVSILRGTSNSYSLEMLVLLPRPVSSAFINLSIIATTRPKHSSISNRYCTLHILKLLKIYSHKCFFEDEPNEDSLFVKSRYPQVKQFNSWIPTNVECASNVTV